MKKKKWLLLIVVLALLLVVPVIMLAVIAGKGMEISTGRYLEAKNGTAMLVIDRSPIQMSNRTDEDLFEGLTNGDKILVVHDGIAESYPGRTGAYMIVKLADGTENDIPENVIDELAELGGLGEKEETMPGGLQAGELFDVTVSYANWTGDSEIYFGALNSDKFAVSSVQHLPIYRFDTLEEMEQFKSSFGEILTMEQGYDEVPSFMDATAKYTEEFFLENSLMLVYLSTGSGSLRFDVHSVYCDGKSFAVHVMQTNHPEIHTEDMAGWFLTVAVSDDMVEHCIEFDADTNWSE